MARRNRRGRRYGHGGPHARSNEFRNRRTGRTVSTGAPYHIHPDKGPMEGAVHNRNIPGGTAGHDFYDRANGNSTSNNRMTGRTSSGGGYRRGGRTRPVRRMQTGGHTHSHRHGLYQSNFYNPSTIHTDWDIQQEEAPHSHPRTVTSRRRMEHGGSHCGPGLMYQNGGCVSYEHGGHHQVINSDSDRQRRKR